MSDHVGTVPIHEAADTNIGMTTILADRGFKASGEVPCRPLHDLLAEDDRKRLTLIKIDMEGAEPPVVRDFLAHLHLYPSHPAVAVEISPNGEWDELFGQMIEAGYRAFDLHNDYDWLTLIDAPSVPPTEIHELPSVQADVLFVAAENQIAIVRNLAGAAR